MESKDKRGPGRPPNQQSENEQDNTKRKGERYHKVEFAAASNPNDTKDVHLSVNGETITVQREKPVVLPEKFLECADHATYQKFVQLPNQGRKKGVTIKLYPYTVIKRDVDELEYKKQIAEGTKKTKQNINRFGYDYEPDDLD